MIEWSGFAVAILALGGWSWFNVKQSQAQYPQAQAFMLMLKANDIMDERIKAAFASMKTHVPKASPEQEALAAMRAAREATAAQVANVAEDPRAWAGILEEIPIVEG